MEYKKKYNDALKSRIEKVLNKDNSEFNTLAKKSIEEILEEVNIYHQELEYQNMELQRIREELEKSQAHYNELFQNAPIGYVVFDNNHYIKAANIKHAEMLDCEPRELTNQSITYFIHPDYQDSLYFLTKELLKNKKPAHLEMMIRSYNKETAVKAQFNVYNNGHEYFFRMAAMDISDVKQIEKELIKVKENKAENTDTSKQKNQKEINKLTVLITEDDETSAFFLSQVLDNKHNELLFARTGKEAVELCKNNPSIDVILMDIKMPDMDGHDATKMIREFNKDIIIIAQTAFALTGDREKALEAGCNDYLTKPVRTDKLLEIINKHLKKKPNLEE